MQSQTVRRDFRRLFFAVCVGYFIVGLVMFFLYTRLSNRIDAITDQLDKHIAALDDNMFVVDRQVDKLELQLNELGRRIP